MRHGRLGAAGSAARPDGIESGSSTVASHLTNRERLAGRDWVMGGADYSIADISLLGRGRTMIGFLRSARAGRL
ncbi:hypothetical protein J2Z50_002632 [Ensifer mexicanus]|nr:hypothetical protein [Sinorhizobium mexicanum]